jgi:hypothetical protein
MKGFFPMTTFDLARPSSALPASETPSFIGGPGATAFQPPVPLSQLFATTAAKPAPAWPIQALLPTGLCLLSGKAHAGYNQLALQFALSITEGTLALDHFTSSSGHVLYLGFNEHINTIQTRVQHLMAGETPSERFVWTNTWQPWEKEGIADLADWLTVHPATRLLVIDSFSSILPPGSSLKHAYQLLHQLKHLAHTHHLAILVLHSMARSKRNDPFDAIACSPLLLETFDTLAVLDHDRGSAQATLHLTGQQLQTHTLELALDTNDGRWSLASSPVRDTLTPERITILEALDQSTLPLTPAQIALTLNKELATTRRLLFTMTHAGLVSPTGDGRYSAVLPITSIQEEVFHPLSLTSPSLSGIAIPCGD